MTSEINSPSKTNMSAKFDAKAIEAKQRARWDDAKLFECGKFDKNRKKSYVLEMFPYPSGRIHMGHVRNYALGDVIARRKHAEGYQVLHPMGWDAFGLPAENAAIEHQTLPQKWTLANIEKMKKQLQKIGLSYDWEREIITSDPSYYIHEQRAFLKFLEHGLAYQKESVINWDPVDNTVLANEQVIDGRGWRSGALVEKRMLKQWFLRITDFASELLFDLEHLSGWPENVRLMQENWIGYSTGALVDFEATTLDCVIQIYTTRPDTIFGASFIAIAYDHELVAKLPQTQEIKDFVQQCSANSTAMEANAKLEKAGVNTGIFATHPFDPSVKIPVYIANFVLSDYGTGAIFGCPGHDERDHEFALKYNLPITQVVQPEIAKTKAGELLEQNDIDIKNKPYTEDGIAINSGFLDGLRTVEAKKIAIKKLEELNKGKKHHNYKLRDWGISRQRYWGCPIPVVHCQSCGVVPIPAFELPVELPENISFGLIGNPLELHPTWKHVSCPKCDKPALRETDTFDTFMESSWYFLRFCSPRASEMVDVAALNYWMPVDQYIGGIEHAILHLLYSRFLTKALAKCGYFPDDCGQFQALNYEPFSRLLTQGMVCNAAYKNQKGKWVATEFVKKTGDIYIDTRTNEEIIFVGVEKMSKSKYNGVNPNKVINQYGADTARLFILSDSPPEKGLEWNDSAVEGAYRYLRKLYNFALQHVNANPQLIKDDKSSNHCDIKLFQQHILKAVHKTIAEVTTDFVQSSLNKAIAKIRELTNMLASEITDNDANLILSSAVRLLNPIAPHITEEIWQILGNKTKLTETAWPVFDPQLLICNTISLPVQVNGKLRDILEVATNLDQAEVKKIALGSTKVQNSIEGKKINKVIYVPNKILNFIVS